MGTGGAPEGVLTAAALRCLGGEIQARFRFRNDEERERATEDGQRDETNVSGPRSRGENLVFAATGVTKGDLLEGVRFFGGGARTHSLVMAYQSKQFRFVDTVHMFDRTGRRASASSGPGALRGRGGPAGPSPTRRSPALPGGPRSRRRAAAAATVSSQPGGTSPGARSESGASTKRRLRASAWGTTSGNAAFAGSALRPSGGRGTRWRVRRAAGRGRARAVPSVPATGDRTPAR